MGAAALVIPIIVVPSALCGTIGRMRGWSIVVGSLVLGACDGGERGASDDAAVPIDASVDAAVDAIDAPPDADPAIVPLLGTWDRAPEVESTEHFAHLTFHADGTYDAIHDVDPPVTGTFVVEGNRVSLDPDGPTLLEQSQFVIAGGRLMMGAFGASGAVTGFVGTWAHMGMAIGGGTRHALVIRDDATFSMTQLDATGSHTFAGVTVPHGTGLDLRYTSFELVLHLHTIDDFASVGYLSFTRAP